MIFYKNVEVDGIKIFYREAGEKNNPTMILFHGFPSSSHMFRDLIPMLEEKFYLIAPDYPGFGQSDIPSRENFSYTFDNLAKIIEKFLEKICIEKFFMYVFDYGAPIGFRIAMKNPTAELREKYKIAFAAETIIGQYTFGTPENSVSPDGYSLDIFYTQRENYSEIQSDLIFDYQNNVKLYPQFQKYLRENQPKLLAVWGKNDPSFIYQGAEAFKKDLPNAEIYFVDSGHFALESHCEEIANLIKKIF